jgi:hypothetical protein
MGSQGGKAELKHKTVKGKQSPPGWRHERGTCTERLTCGRDTGLDLFVGNRSIHIKKAQREVLPTLTKNSLQHREPTAQCQDGAGGEEPAAAFAGSTG